jgi:hypothetical protein
LREAIHGSVHHVPAACIQLGALAGIVPAAVAEPRTALIVGNGGRSACAACGRAAKARTF